ncbi:LPG-synthase-C domain-containing protein [Fusarium sp. LHS14.1]|nr:LPG-synthase-C domain-containing protein [Fusarium sp. LHS14.1]
MRGSSMQSSSSSLTCEGCSPLDTPRLSTSPSSTTQVYDETIVSRTYYAACDLLQSDSSPTSRDDHSINNAVTVFDEAYHLHARTAHMGILDPAYKVFTSQQGLGALLYKLQARTAVVAGEPLCTVEHRTPLLKEFAIFRKEQGLGIAFVGASQDFALYAQHQGWTTLCFGHERVINPLTNKVLRHQASKRMVSQNRMLLDPKRGGTSLKIYCPSVTGVDASLEYRLQQLYDDWRLERNNKCRKDLQAFVTVYDLFSYPASTLFLYTTDKDGSITGLTTLRALGAQNGFHIDPFIASSTAPRGITDLLIVTSMQILKHAEIGYLSLGFEPASDIQEVHGQTKFESWVWKQGYNRVIKSVPVTGKAAYFNKFYPDDSLSSDLFICVPGRGISIRGSLALMQFANMNVWQLLTHKRKHKEPQTTSSS